jgi:TRAP-type C4-dicarboxylate transport system permease small subunit
VRNHPLAGALDGLYRLSIWAAGAAITLMSLIVPWGVFTRYVLGTGSQWPEPVAILLMMVFTFIGAAAAYRANAHIAVTMLTDTLGAGARRALAMGVDVLMAVVSLFVLVYGTRLCLETMGQTISELTWLPVGVTYAPLPIGAAITLVFVLERMFAGEQSQRAVVRIGEPERPDLEGT